MKFVDLNLYKAIRNDYVRANPEFSYYDKSLITYYFSDENLVVVNEFSDIELEFILALLSEINLYSRKTQIVVMTPTREQAKKIRHLIRDYLDYLEVIGLDKTELIDLTLNRHIIVGTPGMILNYLEEHPRSTDQIRQCYLLDAHKIFELGYFSTIKRIFNIIQSKVGIATTKVDDAFTRTLDRLGLAYQLTSKNTEKEFKSSYSKPRLLLACLEEVRDKNILIVVKNRKHLELLRDYFKKKGFNVSENYDVVYQYQNNNIIYLVIQDELKDLNIARFDLVFNYNSSHMAETVRKIRSSGRTQQIKELSNNTRERIEAGLHRARIQLNRISPKHLENSLKSRAARYKDLSSSDIKLKGTDRIREVLFASLLPNKEINERKEEVV